jgi:hypothetical protein
MCSDSHWLRTTIVSAMVFVWKAWIRYVQATAGSSMSSMRGRISSVTTSLKNAITQSRCLLFCSSLATVGASSTSLFPSDFDFVSPLEVDIGGMGGVTRSQRSSRHHIGEHFSSGTSTLCSCVHSTCASLRSHCLNLHLPYLSMRLF